MYIAGIIVLILICILQGNFSQAYMYIAGVIVLGPA